MREKVYRYIKKFNMLEPDQKVVVGVSGGADSMVLIHLLSRMGDLLPLTLFVAHVDHGIRGQLAREDAAFVEAFCKEQGLEFFLKETRVPHLAREWGLSEEQAGRRVRYEFFEEVRSKVGGHRIATAHHRDDQAETILYNLIRGAGLDGLSGMKPLRDGIIIKPLLGISRQEIEDYCHIHGLEYREDHTNEEVIYTRNRIRHRVIPMIEEDFNPNFSQALVRMGDILRDDQEFLNIYSHDIFHRIAQEGDNEIRISLSDFIQCPKAVQSRVLRRGIELLKKNLTGIEYIHIEGVLHLAQNSQVGSVLDLPEGIRVAKDYEYLVLYREEGHKIPGQAILDFQYELGIPGRAIIPQLKVEILAEDLGDWPKAPRMGPPVLDKDNRCIYIDAGTIGHSLYVRNRRDGDRFKPLGMGGTKKLKDFFIDNKVPRHKRDGIPLVVDSNNIIWVAGYQISDDYRITKDTKRVLKLEIKDLSKD